MTQLSQKTPTGTGQRAVLAEPMPAQDTDQIVDAAFEKIELGMTPRLAFLAASPEDEARFIARISGGLQAQISRPADAASTKRGFCPTLMADLLDVERPLALQLADLSGFAGLPIVSTVSLCLECAGPGARKDMPAKDLSTEAAQGAMLGMALALANPVGFIIADTPLLSNPVAQGLLQDEVLRSQTRRTGLLGVSTDPALLAPLMTDVILLPATLPKSRRSA